MRVRKILIVTDEPSVMRLLTQVLQRFDKYNVLQATSYEEALDTMTQTEELDIVLTDYDLGGDKTGGDVFTIAYQRGAELRLMSGYRANDRVILDVLKQFPTARFLGKPFDTEKLNEFLIGPLG